MNTRLGRFLCGFLLASFGEFLIWFATIMAADTNRFATKPGFGNYLASMAEASRSNSLVGMVFLAGIAAFLMGCGFMIKGVITSPTSSLPRSWPSQLDRVSDKIERWDKSSLAEPDAITRPNSSDIQ